MKFLRYFLVGISLLTVGFILLVNWTPNLTLKLVRHQFNTPIMEKPPNYENYAKDVTVIKNQTYPSAFKDNTFDIYLPKQSNKKHPTIIWTHGGGGVGGDKADIEYMATVLAANGYVVFSINYERAPEALYPTAIHQIREFSQHLLNQSSTYQLDISQLFYAGDSAGAQMTSQFIATQTNKELAQRMKVSQIISPKQIRGVLLYCGFYDIDTFLTSGQGSFISHFFIKQIIWGYTGIKHPFQTQLAADMNVMKNLTPLYPPAFVTDGNTGSFESQGKELVKKLQENNTPVDPLFIDKSQYITAHEYQFLMNNKPSEIALQETLRFLEKHKRPDTQLRFIK